MKRNVPQRAWNTTATRLADTPAGVELLRLAVDLGASNTGGVLTKAEQELLQIAETRPKTSTETLDIVKHQILTGGDPLGELLFSLWPARERRAIGAYYTPKQLVEKMVDWAFRQSPGRYVDAGCGSGRFAAAILRKDKAKPIVAIDIDPFATVITRAAASTLGAVNLRVENGDFTQYKLAEVSGLTAFIGNPPYVRHQDLARIEKFKMKDEALSEGHRISGQAGLHAHFIVSVSKSARPGDLGCMVTSAEWLDVRYGSIIRELMLNGLGGSTFFQIDADSVPFADAMSTALVFTFRVGSTDPYLSFSRVREISNLDFERQGRLVDKSALAQEIRWSRRLNDPNHAFGEGKEIELGRIFHVKRGLATGANGFFTMTRDRVAELGLEDWCKPVVSRAREIQNCDGCLRQDSLTKCLLIIPERSDSIDCTALRSYIRSGEMPSAKGRAPSNSTLCRSRKIWWQLNIPVPPPILMTYMTRGIPHFALNPDGLIPLNIAHCLYPKEKLDESQLKELVSLLNENAQAATFFSRTYFGGLRKFEPSDAERIALPFEQVKRILG